MRAATHPNILAVFDIGDRDGAPYIVSELLEGETLREQLTSGPLPVRRALDLAVQVAQGLAAAGADHLRQGSGGPPKLHAKAEAPALR